MLGMGEELGSSFGSAAAPNSSSENELSLGERLLGAGAILLHQQGDGEIAVLATDVIAAEVVLWDTEFGQESYKALLEVEPHLLPRFTKEVLDQMRYAMHSVLRREKQSASVGYIEAVPVIPRVSANWRDQLKAVDGPKPTNQARRVRLEPQHPVEDGIHFTNEWEHRVYRVLTHRQADLPDNDTIGIMPLGAMRVRGHTYEPDLLITYRGCAGVIEIDGPHHKGRASDDKGRERLLRNAGVKHIDRLDVRDSTDRLEVEKFVTDFLRHLSG